MNSGIPLQDMVWAAIPTLSLRKVWMLFAMVAAGSGQSGGNVAKPPRRWSAKDEAAIRSLLADGYETSWNSHQPATAVSSDKCTDDAIFINTTGGLVKGRENFAEMISRLHAPGGPFHDQTRRHSVEELRFIRPDVAIAVVKTLDVRQAGVPTSQETRGLVILVKEAGLWKLNAVENVRIQATGNGQR